MVGAAKRQATLLLRIKQRPRRSFCRKNAICYLLLFSAALVVVTQLIVVHNMFPITTWSSSFLLKNKSVKLSSHPTMSKLDRLRQHARKEQEDFCRHFLATTTTTNNSSINTSASTTTTHIDVDAVDNSTLEIYIYTENDFVSERIFETGTWDPKKLTTLVNVVKAYSKQHGVSLRDVTFVDIGANIGWFTFQLASLGVNVIAVEPSRENMQMMRQSLCLNPHLADRITLLETGLSSSNHTCVLYTGTFNVGDSNMDCNLPDPTNFVPPRNFRIQAIIPCQRIDDLLLDDHSDGNDHRPLHIAAVKMDVEAHEPQVVLGGPRFFGTSGIPFFLIEFIPKMIQERRGDAVAMLSVFCKAKCTIRPEMSERPWACPHEALDPTTWKDLPLMDLIIECPI